MENFSKNGNFVKKWKVCQKSLKNRFPIKRVFETFFPNFRNNTPKNTTKPENIPGVTTVYKTKNWKSIF